MSGPRELVAVVAVALGLTAGHRCVAFADETPPTPTSVPGAGAGHDSDAFFPLMAWDYADKDSTLEAMRDAGINAVAFVRPSMLDACRRFGLKAIVFDESVAGRHWNKPYDGDQAVIGLEALVPKVNAHPAVWGYHLKDEPRDTEFPALGKAAAAVKRLAPGKWPYINLFPGEGTPYDEYLARFIDTVHPTTMSYDRYSTMDDGTFAPRFWSTMAQVRDASFKHGLPFHSIVLTSAHWNYREVTEADLRLQTFGALAYGARGLAYYKFYSGELPILEADPLGNFRMGPLDEFGEKTPFWASLRRVNRMIANLAPTLLKLHSDDVYHLGGDAAAVPARNHGFTEKNLVKAVPKGEMIVGDFTHEDGSRWALIVNRNLERSVRCIPELSVPVKGLEFVSPVTGKLTPYPARNFALAPGQGVLLHLIP